MRPLPLTPSLEPIPNFFPLPSPLSTASSAVSFAGHPPPSSSDLGDDDRSPLPTTLTLSSGRRISLLDPSPFIPLNPYQRYPRSHVEVLQAVVQSSGGTSYQHLVPPSHLSLVASYLNVAETGAKTWFKRPKKKGKGKVLALPPPPSSSSVDGAGGGEEESRGGAHEVGGVELDSLVDEEEERKIKEKEAGFRAWEKERKLKEAREAQERSARIKEAKKEEKKEKKRREKEVELTALKKKLFEKRGKGWEIPELEIEFPEEWVYPEGVFLGGDVRKLEPLVVELGGRRRLDEGGTVSSNALLDHLAIDINQQQHHSIQLIDLEYLFDYPLDPFFSTFSSDEDDRLHYDACIHRFLPPQASLLPRPFSSSSELDYTMELDPITRSSEPSSNSLLFSPTIPPSLPMPLQPALLPPSTPHDAPRLHLPPRTDQNEDEDHSELDFLTSFTDSSLVDAPGAVASSSSSSARLDLISSDEPSVVGKDRITEGSRIKKEKRQKETTPLPSPSSLPTHPPLTPEEFMHIFVAKLDSLLAPQNQPFPLPHHSQTGNELEGKSKPQRLAFQPPTLSSSSLTSTPITWSKPISDEGTPLPPKPSRNKKKKKRVLESVDASGSVGGSGSGSGKRVKVEPAEVMGMMKRACSSSAERERRLEEEEQGHVGDLLG